MADIYTNGRTGNGRAYVTKVRGIRSCRFRVEIDGVVSVFLSKAGAEAFLSQNGYVYVETVS